MPSLSWSLSTAKLGYMVKIMKMVKMDKIVKMVKVVKMIKMDNMVRMDKMVKMVETFNMSIAKLDNMVTSFAHETYAII